jgi:TonB family protein
MRRSLNAEGIALLSAEEYQLGGFSASHENRAIIKSSLIFHLILGAVFVAWMVWDAYRPSPPPIPFVELVEVGALAPPAPPAAKPVAETPPQPPPEAPQAKPESSPPPPIPQVAQVKPPPSAPQSAITPSPKAVEPAISPETAPTAEVTSQEESAQISEEMALPTFAKRNTKSAAAAAGVIGQAGDPRVNVYNSQIRAAVEPRWRPPAVEGVAPGARAIVSFSIDRAGNQKEIRLQSSSGSDVLDQLAIRAVTLARFPPLPAAITKDPYPVLYGFVYEGG